MFKKGILGKAMIYAIRCHKEKDQIYDGKPYDFHLQMVFDIGIEYIHLIPPHQRQNVLVACWTHDVIEDCNQTYTDVANATNKQVAELTVALSKFTDQPTQLYYMGIKQTPFATFVKLCDRIANYEYSVRNGNIQKEEMYNKEMPSFIESLYEPEYKEMFDRLKRQYLNRVRQNQNS